MGCQGCRRQPQCQDIAQWVGELHQFFVSNKVTEHSDFLHYMMERVAEGEAASVITALRRDNAWSGDFAEAVMKITHQFTPPTSFDAALQELIKFQQQPNINIGNYMVRPRRHVQAVKMLYWQAVAQARDKGRKLPDLIKCVAITLLERGFAGFFKQQYHLFNRAHASLLPSRRHAYASNAAYAGGGGVRTRRCPPCAAARLRVAAHAAGGGALTRRCPCSERRRAHALLVGVGSDSWPMWVFWTCSSMSICDDYMMQQPLQFESTYGQRSQQWCTWRRLTEAQAGPCIVNSSSQRANMLRTVKSLAGGGGGRSSVASKKCQPKHSFEHAAVQAVAKMFRVAVYRAIVVNIASCLGMDALCAHSLEWRPDGAAGSFAVSAILGRIVSTVAAWAIVVPIQPIDMTQPLPSLYVQAMGLTNGTGLLAAVSGGAVAVLIGELAHATSLAPPVRFLRRCKEVLMMGIVIGSFNVAHSNGVLPTRIDDAGVLGAVLAVVWWFSEDLPLLISVIYFVGYAACAYLFMQGISSSLELD
ncbi:hypothetical protein JKP88DRAFT_242068 [Tribonema minus]|uniref:Uncharacterized protein n=1 Tax=Tribonema minus TaxID=303371 RepID=A0A835YLH3_9STRA|nr:hypothetical protein JKP88DRAFT_242068 [Tribonema minus]